MKILKIVATAFIAMSVLNAAENFDDKIQDLIMSKKSITKSTNGYEAAQMNKYFLWSEFPETLGEIIKADDAKAFTKLINLANSDELNVDIASLHEMSGYNFLFDIVDNNAVNCLKALTASGFNMNTRFLKDDTYYDLDPKNYPKGSYETIKSYVINKTLLKF